jgi:hypothetical protein
MPNLQVIVFAWAEIPAKVRFVRYGDAQLTATSREGKPPCPGVPVGRKVLATDANGQFVVLPRFPDARRGRRGTGFPAFGRGAAPM